MRSTRPSSGREIRPAEIKQKSSESWSGTRSPRLNFRSLLPACPPAPALAPALAPAVVPALAPALAPALVPELAPALVPELAPALVLALALVRHRNHATALHLVPKAQLP